MTVLKPYPMYCTPEHEWIGATPSHWQTLPNRTLFCEVIDKGHPNAEMLSVTISRGVISQGDLLQDAAKKDSSNLDKSSYKLVRPNDLVYNKMRAWQGAIGITTLRGIVSPAYIVMRPAPVQDPRYLHYLFRIPAFATEAERWSYGITSDQWSLRSEDFKSIYSPLPPLDEQRAIADFLDVMDARISHYIAAKRRMIALLEEQKQAIINQAVTRGLDPDVPLKPSGADWLGDIPAHWEVRKLSHCFSRIGSGTTPESGNKRFHEEGVHPWLNTGDLNDGVVVEPNKMITEEALNEYSSLQRFGGGSLVVAMYGATIGKTGIPRFDFTVNQACCVLTSPRNVDTRYAQLVIVSARRSLINLAVGGGQPNISQDIVRQFRIPVPPLEEQLEIVQYVDERSADLVALSCRDEAHVRLIQEYRTRLISDVVTGNLDVRGVELPAVEEYVDAGIEDAVEEESDDVDGEDEA